MFVRWYVKYGLDKPIDTDALKVLDLERCVGPTRSLALGMVMKMVGAAAGRSCLCGWPSSLNAIIRRPETSIPEAHHLSSQAFFGLESKTLKVRTLRQSLLHMG